MNTTDVCIGVATKPVRVKRWQDPLTQERLTEGYHRPEPPAIDFDEMHMNQAPGCADGNS